MTIAETIKRWRMRAGLTQRQLAKKINRQPVEICDWEKGRKSPTSQNLIKVMEALNVQFNQKEDNTNERISNSK